MHPALLPLIELQKLDQLLDHDESLVARLPAELASLDRMENAKQEEIRAAEEKIKLSEVERRHLELEEQTLRERIAKMRMQQLQTRKNEEFQALETEIAAAEKSISEIEDKELAVLERIDLQNEELRLAKERFAPVHKKIQEQKAEVKAKAEETSRRLEKTRIAASEARSKVEPEILARYDRLVAGGKKNAVVPLSHSTTCSGCHMNVIHQTTLDARSTDKIAYCENCGRILFDPEYEAAGK